MLIEQEAAVLNCICHWLLTVVTVQSACFMLLACCYQVTTLSQLFAHTVADPDGDQRFPIPLFMGVILSVLWRDLRHFCHQIILLFQCLSCSPCFFLDPASHLTKCTKIRVNLLMKHLKFVHGCGCVLDPAGGGYEHVYDTIINLTSWGRGHPPLDAFGVSTWPRFSMPSWSLHLQRLTSHLICTPFRACLDHLSKWSMIVTSQSAVMMSLAPSTE